MIHDALQPEESQIDAVNGFITHSQVQKKSSPKRVVIYNGQIFAKLLTPLNSSFNLSGDDVKAVVVNSLNERGKPWLDEGTILEGCVESAKKATYGQTDGSLVIRFYKARLGNQQIDLFTASDTDDGTIKPTDDKPTTKKQRIRGVLMTVSRIAIPAAIGTGGMSIAISAGAGAVIGAAFSDKGKRIQGTARGAWEGAGLTILDPLVCKGQSVVLPLGTPIQLQVTEPVAVPPYVASSNPIASDETVSGLLSQNTHKPPITNLETHAQLLNSPANNSTDGNRPKQQEDHLVAVNKKIEQNDLAGAITELTAAEALYPDDENLKQMHAEILNLVSGRK